MSRQCTKVELRAPRHVAIIMDGNGRWAAARGLARSEGHEAGLQAVREAAFGAVECGVEYLTLYAFSTENWARPADEVRQLMGLIGFAVANYTDEFCKEGISVRAIGSLDGLPAEVREQVQMATENTAQGSRLKVLIALNYGGRQEIVEAARSLARSVRTGALREEEITESEFANRLYTRGVPDPDLLIRTSGEERLSNFLLWQLAYAEFCFLPKCWPDFTREDFRSSVEAYAHRERRFGRVGE